MRPDAEEVSVENVLPRPGRFPGEASGGRPRVEKMTYRAPGTVSVPADGEGGHGGNATPAAERSTVEKRTVELAETVAMLEQRLMDAERDGQRRLEEALREERLRSAEREKEQIEARERRLAAALEAFRREREEYFLKVEREVVRLALAIATRVLRREAQLDPLLLSGAVRVALEQLGEGSVVRMHVPPSELEAWRKRIAEMALRIRPELIGDKALTDGQCRLECEAGSVELGVREQLKEIERGFFDLLDHRPLERGNGSAAWAG